MSESDTGSTEDLGPKPDADIEPGQPNPGGPDAQPDADGVDSEAAEDEVLSRDADPDANPVAAESVPEEMKSGEDTDTKATRGETDGDEDDVQPEKESPA